MALFLINRDNQEMEIAMISLGKTIYYMKKKIARAQKVKIFSLHLISTGRCRDWEGGMEKATQETIRSSMNGLAHSLPREFWMLLRVPRMIM